MNCTTQVEQEICFNVETASALDSSEADKLSWLLADASSNGTHVLITRAYYTSRMSVTLAILGVERVLATPVWFPCYVPARGTEHMCCSRRKPQPMSRLPLVKPRLFILVVAHGHAVCDPLVAAQCSVLSAHLCEHHSWPFACAPAVCRFHASVLAVC